MSKSVTVELPEHVWKSVRYVLTYQIERLGRKVARSHSDRAIGYDRNRISNLKEALSRIDGKLETSSAEDE